MANLTHKTTYLTEALGRMLGLFKGKPRFEALITSWINEVQLLEDAAWDVYFLRLLQYGNAAGDLLDKIGGLVGQARQGFSDAIYLRLIVARIRSNRSDGKRRTLVEILRLLIPGAVIEAREYPGAITLTPDIPVDVPPELIAFEFLKRAVLAGVRVTLVWMGTPKAETLLFGYTFRADLITQPTADQSPGFYDTGPADPDYIEGGAAAGAFTIDGGLS